TLPELAQQLRIDGEALARTAERFNGFARSGVDPDFHRGENQWKLVSAKAPRGVNASPGTIEEPPVYGGAPPPTGSGPARLLADSNGQVMHQRRRPIPGLYASGNVAATTEHGVGYQAGLSLASAMTFSYLAVRHMIAGGATR